MDKSYRAWYILAALLALVPAGARLWLWQRARPQVVDREMAQAGETLFKHVWQEHDPLCRSGDGLGPVYNATSCVACHHQGGPGGGGGLEHNVTTFTVREGETSREGVVHAYGVGCQETLNDVHPSLWGERPSLEFLAKLQGRPDGRSHLPRGVHISQRNTPALFGANLIDALPARVIMANAKAQRMRTGMAAADDEDLPVGRAQRMADGRIGRFGWKAQTASLSDFVQAACANELGLGNPGHAQPRPLGKSTMVATGLDLTQEQCDQLTAFVASLPRPEERPPESAADQVAAAAGRRLFNSIGCADCHTPDLGSVTGIYSDLLLHRMGEELVGGGSYGERALPAPGGSPVEAPAPAGHPVEAPAPDEWRTPPLWGVADSAPYMHDGRAATLEEAIRLHGGQGKIAADGFALLTPSEKAQLVTFLKTLRAP
jgi:CxxC motif-containing protein (DUF1111 family)